MPDGTRPGVAPDPLRSPAADPASARLSQRWRWQIFAVTWIAYAGFYFVRQAFSVAKLGILDDPAVNHTLTSHTLGLIDAVYLAAYAVGQFAWGSWADRFGPRIVVIGGMAGAVVASAVIGLSTSLVVFGVAMAVQGLAQSTGWAPLCKNVTSFVPVKERGRILGLWCTNYAFGGLAAPPFLGWWAYSVFDSWHAAFLAGSATLAVVLALFVVFQRNEPADVGLPRPDAQETTAESGAAPAPAEAPPTSREIYREILRDRMVLTLSAAYFLLKPARYALLLWGPVIVSERLPEVGKLEATLIPVAFGVAGVLAPMTVGWISDRLFSSRRVPPCVLSLGLLTVTLAAFVPLTATGSTWTMVGVLAVIGFGLYAADALIAGVAAVDSGGQAGAGTATGFVNGCGSVGAILGGLLPGFLSTTVLFYGFAAAAALAGVVMLPHWNRTAVTA
ncbi:MULTISPECIES: MFS transporter [Streptomyces]|uniref:MFS transporter n=1 Tax=Streptomyces TaxID=1883 RepID=UPI002DDC5781|nr:MULTISPECIES: MFS transporter [unclassified Streptomyces]WSD93771.1 MFS transporter [Streptomyces sp. NBC_01474]